MTATAYERILDQLRDQGKKVRQGGKDARAQCPSHATRKAYSLPLAIYNKQDTGKAKVVCFAGCSDALDVLPALGMTVADLYDDRHSSGHGPHINQTQRSKHASKPEDPCPSPSEQWMTCCSFRVSPRSSTTSVSRAGTPAPCGAGCA